MENRLCEIGNHRGVRIGKLYRDTVAGDVIKNNHKHCHDSQQLNIGTSRFLFSVHYTIRPFILYFLCSISVYRGGQVGGRKRQDEGIMKKLEGESFDKYNTCRM